MLQYTNFNCGISNMQRYRKHDEREVWDKVDMRAQHPHRNRFPMMPINIKVIAEL